MLKKNFFRLGFTLAEIVITMLIISVVVAMSIKVSKSKLSNTKSYVYYSAYTVLDNASKDMLEVYDETNNLYIDSPGGTSSNTSVVTLPRKGANYCSEFASIVNTSSQLINGGQECTGDSISASTTDFSSRKPDIVLSNGIKIFNLRQNPAQIALLRNNTNSLFYVTGGGTQMDIDESGYTVYVDIDGSGGNSVLWDDVYPFYITMSGKVYPAYNMAMGATGKNFLTASVYDESVGYHNGRIGRWIRKSVNFKEAACQSGFAKEATSYCRNSAAVATHNDCKSDLHDCKILVLPPSRFFN